MTLPGSGGTVTFKYDPFGRRIYKSSSSGTSVFAYDNNGNLIEETDTTGIAVARYAQGLRIDDPLAELRSGVTYYQADGLGTVTSLSSSTGSVVQTYTYDSFGSKTASSGSLTNPFQYTARELDTETGLYYYRARYYDPISGRFLSEDTARFGSGENFYAYSNNSPITFSDPLGLGPCSAADVSRCTRNCESKGLQLGSCFNINTVIGSFSLCSCKDRCGNCEPLQHALLQAAVNTACKSGPSACKASQTCAELKANLATNLACAWARNRINNICYDGGDAGHKEAAANAAAAAAKCAGFIAAKGCT